MKKNAYLRRFLAEDEILVH